MARLAKSKKPESTAHLGFETSLPLKDSDWCHKGNDVHWQLGIPPKGNFNFAWPRHASGFICHIAT